jgi:putative ABC transport system permease protein
VLEKPATREDVARYVESTLGALAAVPGTQAVAAANLLPLRGGGSRSKISLPSGTSDPNGTPTISYAGVSPGFFGALGIPLLQGRSFGPEDAGRRVAVVNRTMADRLWPNQDPIGEEFALAAAPQGGWITVVGVSGDVAAWDSGDRHLPTAYVDATSLSAFPTYFFVRRPANERIASDEPLTRAIDSLKYTIERITPTPMDEVARSTFWRQRLFSLVLTAFGIAALTLTGVGIYGVLAFLVWQRSREIGIRMALGAEPKGVLRMVLTQATRVVTVGVVIGVGGAYAVARIARGLLFGVAPFDAALFLGVTAILTAVALIASLAPAFRAARISPSDLLRE